MPLSMATLPLAAVPEEVMVSASPSTSLSLASTSMSTPVFSFVSAASSTATGASLTGWTVTETAAKSESRLPSLALYVNASGPW